MRLKQELVNKKDENAKRAIEAHAGFITCVTGHVKRYGIKAILSAKDTDEYYWVKSAYKRVLDFAEQIQIKREQPKNEPSDNAMPPLQINLQVENAVSMESKTEPEPGFQRW